MNSQHARVQTASALAMIFAFAASTASAQLPVTGRSVSQLAWLDTEVLNLMNQNNITGGMVAVMRNGKVIYQRGFGWLNSQHSFNMPENSLCRIASCTKPFTAACVQRLISQGFFGLNSNAFTLGQPGGGILNSTPFPSLGDSRLQIVTIQDLLIH